LLILGLLYGLFNSLRDSLIVLSGFLFAAAGGTLALAVSGEAFGISAAIGFVSLLGISVMNGIILITYFNEVRGGGLSSAQAMLQAATQRCGPY
jgi:heavy metal efflux system protein